MNLRLVAKDNVAALPVANMHDIAAAAQGFADAIADGDLEGLETVVLITKRGGRVDFAVLGESPSIAEGIGLLELAKAKVIAGAWRE